MNDDTKHNERASDATSPADLSETEYLAREAEQARGAISNTIGRMRQSLVDAADVRAWARRYPWATVGAAAAAGFVAAAALVPGRRREQPEPREPSLLERILSDEQIAERLKQLAAEDEARPPRDSTARAVVSTLVQTFGPAVQSAILSALAAKAAPPETSEPSATPETDSKRPNEEQAG